MGIINQLITEELSNPCAHIEQILEEVFANGDIMLIKVDGPRQKNRYTVVVIGKNNEFPTFRMDQDSLEVAIIFALQAYAKHRP